MYDFGMGFGGGFMWLLWIVLICVIAWGVWAANGGSGRQGAPRRSARELLDERYARGEIDDEEYERRREQLEQ